MFSVVIPLYNKEKIITRTIESVIHQTKQNFEIIVIDDGSTDGSARRVRELQCDRIHLIQQPNGGIGPARNRGVQESRYEYIVFLDADDAFLPDHLEEIQKIMVVSAFRVGHAASIRSQASFWAVCWSSSLAMNHAM
jgi:glycosyltransferase involved in cell wall biosynthesis